MDWIGTGCGLDRYKCAVVEIVTKLWVLQNVGDFLTS